MTWLFIQASDESQARAIVARLRLYFGPECCNDPLPGNPSGYIVAIGLDAPQKRQVIRAVLAAHYEGKVCHWPSLLRGVLFTESEV